MQSFKVNAIFSWIIFKQISLTYLYFVFLLISTIIYSDLSKIAPENYVKNITLRVTDIKAVDSPADRSILIQALESAYRFTLGSVAGGMYSFC